MLPKLVDSQRELRGVGIVPLVDVGLDAEDTPWIITEGAEGESLRWVMTSLGTAKSFIKPHEGLAIVQRVAQVMEPLHQRNLVHGDLCPSTIFVTTRGQVALLDAGVASALGQQEGLGPARSESGSLAPEQLTGPATAATDVFRLGLVLYELSIGRPLFSGASPAHVCHAVGSWMGLPRDKVKHVPEPWLSLLVTMLSVDPRTRPSMEEVSAVLSQSADTNGWKMGEPEVAELFARSSPGRTPYFTDTSPGTVLTITSVTPPIRTRTPSGNFERTLTPTGNPPVQTPQQTARAMTPPPGAVLARVTTRKMTREAL
ncbi:MAG: protein kinase domain-containing protein, partial [Archangium sp.]